MECNMFENMHRFKVQQHKQLCEHAVRQFCCRGITSAGTAAALEWKLV